MEDFPTLVCPHCEVEFTISLNDLQASISHYKIGKMLRVSDQLHKKQGPYYDRWMAAMEARGEQKRCKDCIYLTQYERGGYCCTTPMTWKKVTPGYFACSWFKSTGEGGE